MSEPIKTGDRATIIAGALGDKGPNVGKRVTVGTLRGEHSQHGRIWRVHGEGLITEYGFVGTEVDCAADLPEARLFTKKPVTIAALQWTGKNLREVITFTDGPPDTRTTHAGMAWEAYADLVARDGLKIYTLEGKMLASPGDWIITGVAGEHYACKPDIFEATYSPAALAAGQATAPQVVVQDDLITLRKPTTSAELLWLLKLAHLVISDVDKTLEETFAPAQPVAQQAHHEEQPDGTTIPIDPSEMAPPQPASAPMSPANRLVAYSAATRLRELGFEWDATAEAWLQPAPSAQAAERVTAPAGVVGPNGMTRDELRSMIEGMSVSVDVSTGDHDAGHRYFGTVTEVMECQGNKHGVTLLVQDAEPNFTATPTAPSTPSSTAQQASAHVLNLVQDAFAEVAMAYPKAFALHKAGLADTAVRKALAAYTPQAADSVLEDAARESEYRRGYRHGYEQRDAEVRGAMA